MHSRTEEIKFTTYFNEILNHFYEDARDIERLGKTLGFDVKNHYFMAVTYMYPSIAPATFTEKQELRVLFKEVTALPKINQAISEQQFLYIENGVVTFLVGESKQELIELLPAYKEQAVQLIKEEHLDRKVRMGIGLIESGVKGIKKTYNNATNAVYAGEIFKKERPVLEYMSMEIYSSINAMITNYGDRMTTVVLKQLDDNTQRILAKYYKCKEEIDKTAEALGIPSEDVAAALVRVKENTGLDVNDTEDNFKLHLVMIAKKVLGTNEKIEEVKKNQEKLFDQD